MIRKTILRLFGVLLALTGTTETIAQTQPNFLVTVNGQPVVKHLKAVYLTKDAYAGQTYAERRYVYADMVCLVSGEGDDAQTEYLHPLTARIVFGDDIALGVESVSILDAGNQDGQLHIKGLPAYMPAIVYDASGRQCQNTRTTADGTLVNADALPRGLYIVKAGQTAIKFNKK